MKVEEFVPPLENECIPPPDIKALSTVKPKYLTNPNAFLVPILIWGPNNQVGAIWLGAVCLTRCLTPSYSFQIRGFIETVFLAIKLNRTLLIPPFFRHQSELGSYNDHASILPPERVAIQPYYCTVRFHYDSTEKTTFEAIEREVSFPVLLNTQVLNYHVN